MLRISLDLDDTIFSWRAAHEKKFNCKIAKTKNAVITKQVESVKDSEDFWSNLQLIEKPDFIPVNYCTKRINQKQFTINCLKKYQLPLKPIIQLYNQGDNKGETLKGVADVLIDDSIENVLQCILSGFPALLITRPHNRYIKTKYRVSHLKYKEIEQKYNELFK